MGSDFYFIVQLTAGVRYTINTYSYEEDTVFTIHVEYSDSETEVGVKSMALSISEDRPYLVKDQLMDGNVNIGYIYDGKFRFNQSVIKEMIVLDVVFEDDTVVQWHYSDDNRFLNQRDVDFVISETADWEEGGENLVTVTYSGVTKTISIPVKSQLSIGIDGFSISPVSEGARTIYTVTDMLDNVQEVGLVYGIKKNIDEADLYVGNSNEYVVDYKATNKGKIGNPYANDPHTSRYAMTMMFGNVGKEFFEETISVRAYAKLKDGSIVYSNVEDYSIFGVASKLYTKKQMPTKIGHEYLYNKILKVVDINYSEIAF